MYIRLRGMTTRLIGAIIMVHGDDSGLVLPPRIAPVQVDVIPIMQNKEGVLDKAHEVLDTLRAAGLRAKLDDTDKSPGWKFSEQEMRGIPVRVEMGPRDIEANQAILVRRDTREKITVISGYIGRKDHRDLGYHANRDVRACKSTQRCAYLRRTQLRGVQGHRSQQAGIYPRNVVW